MPERRRALFVLNCGLAVPSATVRALQYRPNFEASAAWTADFVSRKSEELTSLVNRTFRPTVPLMVPLVHRPLAAYNERWERKREDAIVEQARGYDLVYLIKMPHLQLYRRLRALEGPRVVMDFNDGLWLPIFRHSGWKDLEEILAVSHGVICENEHVAAFARRHNSRVCVVPDSPQVEAFDRVRAEARRDPARITIGWIGTPATVGGLYRIWEPLEALFARHPSLHLRILGADRAILPPFESVRWSCRPFYGQDEMVAEALAFDIGLFPMFHTGDAMARGNLKAMIYMSAGAAALCENYGENPRLIVDGVNGVLASTPEEWLRKLEWLVADEKARREIGRRGLETIRGRFSAAHVFAELEAAFDQFMAAKSDVGAAAYAAPAIA